MCQVQESVTVYHDSDVGAESSKLCSILLPARQRSKCHTVSEVASRTQVSPCDASKPKLRYITR